MRFVMIDHAGKGAYLRQKLLEAGHVHATDGGADLLLADCDWPWAGRRRALIAGAKAAGAKVALYPHGAMPTGFVYDGLCDPDPNVDMRLEHGDGHVELVRRFTDDDLKQRPVGWLYCPTRPFKPVPEPRRLLFAPMHPNMELLALPVNGHDPAPAQNQRLYRQLLETDFELTVSVVGPPHRSGIWPHPRTRIVANHTMAFPNAYQILQDADVVVAAGTMAAAAVALGIPTVMFAQEAAVDYVGGVYQRAAHADLYQDLVRYPIDADTGSLIDLIDSACAGDVWAEKWRYEFVGNDGTDQAVTLLEQLVGTSSAENVTIQGVRARAGARY